MSDPLHTPFIDDKSNDDMNDQAHTSNIQQNNNDSNDQMDASNKNIVLNQTTENTNDIESAGSQNDIIYPEETKWKYIWPCCRNHVARILPTTQVYCGYWMISPCMPINVCCFVLYALCVHFIIVFPRLSKVSLICSTIEISIFVILFFISYFSTACSDPGYLPYDWVKTKKTKYTWTELLEGTAIRDDQFEFAKNHKCPFASFSNSVGRHVIRADHICGWVTNWIGKRNHKQFILMLLYGSIMSISLFAWQWSMNEFPFNNIVFMILLLVADALEVVFGVMLVWTFLFNINNLFSNETKISQYKNESTNKYGPIDSMRQICGNGSIFCWLCPIPAFNDTELDILLETN